MNKQLFGVLLSVVALAAGCTNLIVSPGASSDKSSLISYAADSSVLYGCLYHWPHATHQPGEMIDIVEWDTGHPLGKIPQVPETFNVVGNTNEWGLAIGETTFGGVEILQHQPKGIVDYGSLIYVALQRAKTAREAIAVMTDLVARYGYFSEGESFSIADPTEVWVLEMIGKGAFELGAVWVALRVPDGHITAHANQARIRQFPRNSPDTCVYSPDVVSFAKAHGLYPASAPDADFSFSDVYNPLTVSGARGCEMRVWAYFREYGAASYNWDQYIDYVSGYNLTHRMPWSVVPARKLSPRDVMHGMRNHLEGTHFAFQSDVGAGPFELPYRWRPMDFAVKNRHYTNERSTSTQQTGFVFVAQLRPNVPRQIAGVDWFGVDDAACAVFAPFYSSMTRPPSAFREGFGGMMQVNLDAAFWVFNLACNLAYTRWDLIHSEMADKQDNYETSFAAVLPKIDAEATSLINAGRTSEALELLTNFSTGTGDSLVREWKEFWLYLVARYLDGNVKTPVPGERNPHVDQPGYGQAWYDRIVAETGDKYLLPDELNTFRAPNSPSPALKLKL